MKRNGESKLSIMGRENFEMRDSTAELNPEGGKRQGGCVLSIVMGFVLILLAVVMAVGVGLIVFFAVGGDKDAQCLPEAGAQTGEQGGVWWPDKECLTTCIKDGYCGEDGSKPEGTTAAGEATTAMATTTAASTDGKPVKVRDVRLPLWLIPVHYDIDMKPDIYQADPEDFTNTGTVMIHMRCDAPTKIVTVHANKLVITSQSMEDNAGTNIPLGSPVYDGDRQFVNFTLQNELVQGQFYNITLGYSGKLDNDLAGLYYSSYDELDAGSGQMEKRYIATTQYQATDARKAFPCFDEPGIKATFTTTLWRKSHMTALSNMPIASNMTMFLAVTMMAATDTRKAMPCFDEPELKATFAISIMRKDPMRSLANMPLASNLSMPDGWVKDTFEPTVKMSTYLLAMIICDFDYKEQTTATGIKMRVWSRKSAINQVDYALQQGVDILEYFENFFDEPFPLPKTDMIAIPDFAAGAMENWGLITYRETALLYDPNVSAASNKQRVAVVVSHELAHQWFGNLVTPSWWDDLWLNEGFASYVEYIGVNVTEPEWQMMEQFVVVDVHSTLRADSLASSHPIYVPVQHPDEVNEIFDSISYGKGGSLIRMMRYFLGDSIFQNALANYIDEKAYQAAHHTDLWKAMQDEADKQGLKDQDGKALDIKAILDTWILQMGYPLLTITMEPSPPAGKHHLKMTQKHFLQDDTQTPDPKYPSPFDYRWDIPISYVSSENPNFDVDQTSVQWFTKDQASKTIEVNNDLAWMIVNPKQYGFYRVNYPSEYWQKIIDQQAADHTKIDELNRAQIIDDAFDLALAGKLSITYAMELTKYLLKEESWFAWDAAITSLSYVSSALKRTEAYGDFKTYYKTLITPFYDKFNNGWAVDLTSSIVEQYRQRDAVSRACSYNVGDCRAKAKELVTSWMSNPDNNPISPNLRDTAYCYAVKQGDEAVWDFIFEKFQNENVAGEQIKLLRSLGCTDEMWLLQRLLDYAIDDTKVRKQDSYIAVGAVAGNTLGKFLAWDWLRGNWEQLYSEFSVGIMMLGRFVTSSLDKRFTQFDYDQIVAFTDQTEELGSATRAFAQKKEGTQANIKYLERNLDDLVRWLSSQP